MVIAACGSSATAGPTSSGSPADSNTAQSESSTPPGQSSAPAPGADSSAASGNAGIDYANAQLKKYSSLPTFTPPGPSFDAKKLMAGKTIYSIGVNNADQFVGVLQDGMKEVAKQVGFTFKVYENQGSLSEWVKGMQTAINEKANVIDLLAGIDPTLLQPQIKQAQAAGIKVVSSDTYDENQPAPTVVDARADVPYAQVTRLMADYVIAQSNGKADVLLVGSSDVAASDYQVAAGQDEFKQHCGSACKVKTIDVTVANWASQTQPQVEAALNADPGIDYVLPLYDSQSQFIVPAIKAAGKEGSVKIVSYDGTPFVLQMIQDGSTVVMDAGEDLGWVSRAIMDQDMRVAAGLAPVKRLNTPIYIFTKDNVNNAGVPPQNSTGYGNADVCGYQALWQMTGSGC